MAASKAEYERWRAEQPKTWLNRRSRPGLGARPRLRRVSAYDQGNKGRSSGEQGEAEMWKWMVLPLAAGLAAGCASSPPPPVAQSSPPPPVAQTSYATPAPDIAPKPEKVAEPAPKKASQCHAFSDACGVVPVYHAPDSQSTAANSQGTAGQKPEKAAEPAADKAPPCHVFSDPCGVVQR